MRALLQSWKTGEIRLVDVPAPLPRRDHIVVRTRASLVSAGTERAMLDLAGKSLIGKALARPDLVRQVLDKLRSDGPLETWRQAMGRLDVPVPLGYSSAGVVEEVGPGVQGLTAGDRVACTGSGYASHAELVLVPANLCVRLPDEVDFEAGAFGALGGVALEAIRVARCTLGEVVVVIGLGLLGQLAVQLLSAAGCAVIGMDPDGHKATLARAHGADTSVSDYGALGEICRQYTRGAGVDAVIIMAAASSNEPLEQAAELCRERGRVVATGLVGLTVPRRSFYEKELELVVSRGWGPGLYDLNYRDRGLDYPIAYARWTAGRNVAEFIRQVARGAVGVQRLVTHRFPLDRAAAAYDLITRKREPYVAVLLTYSDQPPSPASRVIPVIRRTTPVLAPHIGVGVIGAGQYARGTLLPLLVRLPGLRLRTVVAGSGVSARQAAERFGFLRCATDPAVILEDEEISAVFILTRHGSHAALTAEALRAGKHVFVEKPLALTLRQLQGVLDGVATLPADAQRVLMVGFNRRFSPCARWLRQRIREGIPLGLHCTVNAGTVPGDSWVHDLDEGGGRILGEVCHFIDLVSYLAGSSPVQVFTQPVGDRAAAEDDSVMISLEMANKSAATVAYLAGGDKRFSRERIEVFGGGAVGVIDNFRGATYMAHRRVDRMRSWMQSDRGHLQQLRAFIAAIRSGVGSPVPLTDYVATTLATLAVERSRKEGRAVTVSWDSLT